MAYSDEQQAEALVKLALNKGDYDKTAAELGVSSRTLRRWAKGEGVKKRPEKMSESVNVTLQGTVAEMLEQAVKRLLGHIPEKMTASAWAVALGILLDKWLLFEGHPTQRTENIDRQLRQLPDDDYYDVLAEAQRILQEAGGGADPGGGA